MNLWLQDKPLFYQPSRGQAISLQLLFKTFPDATTQFEMQNTAIFSFGQNWFSPWHRYLSSTDGSTFTFLNGVGGAVAVTSGGSADYRSYITCSLDASNNPVINYPSGAQDVFDYASTDGFGTTRYFPTTSQDPYGNVTTFNWETTNGAVCLASITDVDGKTTSFSYTNINSFMLVYQVNDPCGHTATLQYDGSSTVPNLTNITDAAGISSSLSYATNGIYPASLTTPYGTTTFALFGGFIDPSNNPPAIHINELGLRDHLYVYVDTADPSQVTNSLVSFSPSTSPFGNTLDTNDSNLRNTFYWGPRQYPLLSPSFVAGITNSTNQVAVLANLFATNYLQARMRHWLIQSNVDTSTFLGQTLSLERAPSPDGTNPGQITWYDYDNKLGGNPEVEGTMILPKFKAWVLPNGQSCFKYFARNTLGHPTTTAETYSDSGNNVLVRTNILTYAANNIDVLSVTNALGVCVQSNVFNSFHQVTTNFDALSEKTVYTYDSNHRLTGVQIPAGLTVTNIFGSDGYLASNIDLQISRTNTYTWTNGLMRTHTDERGLTVTNAYDGLNRLIKTTYPDGTYITNTYSNLDLVTVVDRMGFTNRFIYNGFRQIVHQIDALNRTNTYGYCNCGSLTSITDPLTNTTTFFYDVSGRRVSITYADGYTVSNRLDLLGRATNVFDSAGTSATNWFNNQGLLYAVSNSLGRAMSKQFDILDRVTNSADANGVTLTNTYDPLNRLLTRAYPDGGIEKFGYSTNGLIAYTNQLNHATHYGYDAALRKTSETNANSEVTQYSYDAASDLLTLTDGNTNTTTWHYDIFGNVSNKVDAAGNVVLSYTYDMDNRLTNRNSIAKGNTAYSYDKAGNLTNVTYNTNHSISLAYDRDNRLTNMVDGVGTTAYGYDAVGQLLSEDGPWANDTVSYTYNNRLRSGLSLQQPDADAWMQNYAFDSAKRLTNIISPAGGFTYAYDATRQLRVSKLSLPNGSYITNTYDSVARLTGTTLDDSTNSVLNFHGYGYNVGNQRTNQSFTAGNFLNYTYDNIGQLTTAFGKESGGVTNRLQEQLQYAYDAGHNLNIRTNNALVETFNANNLNELSNITRNTNNALTVAGTTSSAASNVTVNGNNAALYADYTFASTNSFTVTNGNNTFTAIAGDSLGRHDTNSITVNLPATNSYSYDLNGNLLSDGTRAFDYDDENELVRVTVTNAWKSEFTYDGKFRMRIRKEFSWQTGTWVQTNEVQYVYDGNVVIQERDVDNLPLVTYTRGNDLNRTLQGAGGIGGLLARTDNTVQQTAFYHADGNGNITALVNAQQVLVAKYLYDAFGNIISQSGPLADANVYRFSSKEYHVNSGLIYYLYRFYDSNLQRWMNRDLMSVFGVTIEARSRPLSRVPAEIITTPNLYEYCFNSPNQCIDIAGMLGFGFDAGAGGAFGFGPGYSGTGSVGGGIFLGPNPNGSPASFGGFCSGGLSLPDSYGNFGLGAAGGLGGFFTNADNANQLALTTNTVFINIGLGLDIGISFSWGNGIFLLEFYPPGGGVGGGLSAGYLQTTTTGGTVVAPIFPIH